VHDKDFKILLPEYLKKIPGSPNNTKNWQNPGWPGEGWLTELLYTACISYSMHAKSNARRSG
jgi:hypothetical protein